MTGLTCTILKVIALNLLNCMTSHKNCFKYYFINRIFDAWNFLPHTCFNTNLTASFKNKLDKINFNAFISD